MTARQGLYYTAARWLTTAITQDSFSEMKFLKPLQLYTKRIKDQTAKLSLAILQETVQQM